MLSRLRIPGHMRIAIELIRDFAQRDPSAFHQFLWSNHLAYADGFDLRLFEPGRLGSTRERLLDLMCRECLAKGIEPARDHVAGHPVVDSPAGNFTEVVLVGLAERLCPELIGNLRAHWTANS